MHDMKMKQFEKGDPDFLLKELQSAADSLQK